MSDTRRIVEYTVPLGQINATLFLPRDITEAEAERICALIRTLPIPTSEGA